MFKTNAKYVVRLFFRQKPYLLANHRVFTFQTANSERNNYEKWIFLQKKATRRGKIAFLCIELPYAKRRLTLFYVETSTSLVNDISFDRNWLFTQLLILFLEDFNIKFFIIKTVFMSNCSKKLQEQLSFWKWLQFWFKKM